MPQSTMPYALVIDPDAAQQQVIAHALHPHFKVVWRANLADAFGQIRAHHPTLILMELTSPEESTFSWIRERRKEGKYPNPYPTIVCLTNHSSVADKVRAFQAGADDYLVKPIQANTFLAHIRLLLRVSQQQHG